MKITVVTDDGREHETEISPELMCHSDISNAMKNNINPADALIELAGAGSKALRGNKIKPEGNDILMALLSCDQEPLA
ncbi:MAG: hypothetical protein WC788_06920 [Candidatus Paceibacterota bacterium]